MNPEPKPSAWAQIGAFVLQLIRVVLKCAVLGFGLVVGFLYLPQLSEPPVASTPNPEPSAALPAVPSTILTAIPAPMRSAGIDALRQVLGERQASATKYQVRDRCTGSVRELPLADMYPALGLIVRHPMPYVRLPLLDELFTRWVVLDREGALAAALSVMSPQAKARAVNRVLEAWVKTDEAAAWAWVGQLDDSILQSAVVNRLLTRCAAQAPAHYAEWAATLSDPFLRRQSLDRVAIEWARRDAPAALAWAQQQTEPNTRRALLSEVLAALSNRDPKLVFNTAASDPDAAVRHDILAQLLELHSRRDAATLLAWIAQTNLTADLQQPLNAAAKSLASLGITKLQATATRLPEGPLREAFLSGAAEAIASAGDPQSAWLLLQNLAASVEKNSALWSLGAAFASSPTTQEAANWLSALPASQERDSAIAGYASKAIAEKPQLALDWIAQMQNASERSAALSENFARWHRASKGASMAWLWATPRLSAAEKKALAR